MLPLLDHTVGKRLTLLLFVLLSCSVSLAPFALAQGGPPPPAGPGREFGIGNMPGPPGPRFGTFRRGFRGPRSEARLRRFGQMRRGGLVGLLRRPELQRELSLTDDQRKKLEEIAFNASKAQIQERANLQLHRLELSRLMRVDNPDRAAIDRKLQDISQAELRLSRAMTNTLLDGRNVLTKEQRDKLAQLMQERRGERRQMRAPGGRGPAGGVPPGRTQPAQPSSPPTPGAPEK